MVEIHIEPNIFIAGVFYFSRLDIVVLNINTIILFPRLYILQRRPVHFKGPASHLGFICIAGVFLSVLYLVAGY